MPRLSASPVRNAAIARARLGCSLIAGLLGNVVSAQVIGRPLPVPPGGGVIGGGPIGGGPIGGGPGIGNPIVPIFPGGGGIPTGPQIVTDAGMLAGQSSQASVVLPAQPPTAAAPGGGGGTTPATTYQWTISGGRITSDPTRQSVTFTADAAGTVALNVVVVAGASAQSTSAEIVVLSPALAGAITSPATVATNAASISASVPAAQSGDRTFRWSLVGSGAAIAAGQGTNTATIRPGAPGLLEVQCDVTLQRIATVTLRSFVLVTGQGARSTLTVTRGSGGGSFPAGSRIDILADPPAADEVFDRWIGDTSVLGSAPLAALLPRTTVTVPATGAALTATYKPAPSWSPTVVNSFNPIAPQNPAGTSLWYHIPEDARGVVFLLHDTGAAGDVWFTRPEPCLLARDLVAAGFGIAALSSANRTNGSWSLQPTLAANPDAASLAAALDRFGREERVPPGTPVFLLGMGDGADAAARFAHLLTSSAPARPIRGVVLFGHAGTLGAALASRVPHLFALAAHDDVVGDAGAATARENAQLLTGRGIASAVLTNAASPLHPSRLRRLDTGTTLFSATDAQAALEALRTAGFLDVNSYPKSLPSLDSVRTVLPANLKERAADVHAQLTVAYAGHEFFSDANARVLSFLQAQSGSPAPTTPARLVNLSTRTGISYLGDSVTLGFVLAGRERATLLIRGVGPSLGRFGASSPLPAPRLEVTRGSSLVAANEGWDRAENAAAIAAAARSVGAFALGQGELDAALLLTLEPGAYTATIRAINGAVGDVLAEIYDVSRNSTRVTNFSTLGKITADRDVLLPGIALIGANPRTLLVRVVGPGLADVGLGGEPLLPDPRLAVASTTGQGILANNNWTQLGADGATALSTLFSALGAFPLRATSGDAAAVHAFAPGNYFLQANAAPGIAPAGATTGTVLVEVFEVP